MNAEWLFACRKAQARQAEETTRAAADPDYKRGEDDFITQAMEQQRISSGEAAFKECVTSGARAHIYSANSAESIKLAIAQCEDSAEKWMTNCLREPDSDEMGCDERISLAAIIAISHARD